MIHLLLAFALASPLAQPFGETPVRPKDDVVDAFCQGCGCRGGPGWRIHRTGQCAGKRNLHKECGTPPSPALCTKEN